MIAQPRPARRGQNEYREPIPAEVLLKTQALVCRDEGIKMRLAALSSSPLLSCDHPISAAVEIAWPLNA
jgi:hypothetical protein